MRISILIFALLLASFATADERVLNFHSDIAIRADGWVEVTEIITVRAEGSQIRRGIYRDYPVRYRDRIGNSVKVLYDPRSVLRNGESEAFNTEPAGDYLRTYFGSASRLLDPGEHTYTYRYDAGRMLGFYDQHDELYWNVTGVESVFPIDAASATVSFDFDVGTEALVLTAYTGRIGETDDAYVSSVDAQGRATFAATRPLGAREGLTIVVEWPKGLVDEPSGLQQVIWMLQDNLNLLIALAGLAAMFGYYIPVWKNYGRDPAPGVVFTRYEPPVGFSPASLRYIENMMYQDESMTAAIISLGTKGYLRIDVDDDEHTLVRTDPGENPKALATGESELCDALFYESDSITLVDENHERIAHARDAHERSLKFDYHKRYFVTNGALNLPAFIVAVVSAVVALLVGPSFFVLLTIGLMFITFVVFAVIMKRPTAAGRKLLDEVEGFREYLEIAEKDEMNLRNPPEKTPALFEAYLPFALALGVEQQWAERFTRIFAGLEGPTDTGWQPPWYNGSWDNGNFSTATSSLSSDLGNAISASVTPPGSSSGGGGGGFSGGGGGGGGVGGW
jgi:uncharacterized membrane protein YgcG